MAWSYAKLFVCNAVAFHFLISSSRNPGLSPLQKNKEKTQRNPSPTHHSETVRMGDPTMKPFEPMERLLYMSKIRDRLDHESKMLRESGFWSSLYAIISLLSVPFPIICIRKFLTLNHEESFQRISTMSGTILGIAISLAILATSAHIFRYYLKHKRELQRLRGLQIASVLSGVHLPIHPDEDTPSDLC